MKNFLKYFALGTLLALPSIGVFARVEPPYPSCCYSCINEEYYEDCVDACYDQCVYPESGVCVHWCMYNKDDRPNPSPAPTPIPNPPVPPGGN